MRNTLGERLKLLRTTSRKVFAANYGIHEQSLIRYENNTRHPDREIIQRIADGEGVNFEWLLNGIEPMYKTENEKTGDSQQFLNDLNKQGIEITNKLENQNEKTGDMSPVFELQQEIISLLKEKNELIQQNADLRFQLKERDDRIRELEDKIATLREALTKASAIQRADSREVG